MSKKRTIPTVTIILIVGIVALLGILAIVFAAKMLAPQVATPSPSITPSSTVEANTQNPTSSTTTTKPGAYVDYSDSVIANTGGIKLLFFHAPWCPQCRALDASIKAGPIPDGTTIIKTDYDSNQKLRQKYGVTVQTTIVRVDDSGNLVKKYVAYDKPTLENVIKNTK